MFGLATLLFASDPVSATNAALKAGGHRTINEFVGQMGKGEHRDPGEWLKQDNHRSPFEWFAGVPSRNKKQ